MLIGLGSKAGVGKDTIADVLVRDYGFVKESFAAPIKDLALRINPIVIVGGTPMRYEMVLKAYGGLDGAKRVVPEVRRFLQQLGSETRRVLNPNVWIEALEGRIVDVPNVVISDVRYSNEVNWITSKGGFAVELHRLSLDELAAGHESEWTVGGGWSWHVDNDAHPDEVASRIALLCRI